MRILLLLLGCVTLVTTVFSGDSEQGDDAVMSICVYPNQPQMSRSRLLRTFHRIVNRMAQEKASDPKYVQKVKLYWQNYDEDDCAKERILQQISGGDYEFAIKTFLINEGYKDDSQLLKLDQVLRAMP